MDFDAGYVRDLLLGLNPKYTPDLLPVGLCGSETTEPRISSLDSVAFHQLKYRIRTEGAAFSALQAYDVVRNIARASVDICGRFEEDCLLGLSRMPGSQQNLLWDAFASGLGFCSIGKIGTWTTKVGIDCMVTLNASIPEAITTNAVDQTRAFLISGYYANDPDFSLPAKAAGEILCTAVANQKASLPEILEDHLSVLLSGHSFGWNEYQTIVRTMQSVIPSYLDDDNTKKKSIAVPVSFVERINDAMLYGIGNPPSFDLRSTLVGLVSTLNSAGLIQKPACRPNEKPFSPVVATHLLKV